MNIQDIINEEIYHYYYPNVRGEMTFDKVVKRIKGVGSLSTTSDLFTKITYRAYQELIRFSSPEEIMEHVFWHGSGGGVSKGLQAGFNIIKKGTEGGGGYGEQYHTISLSKSKNVASNFTGLSRYGTVYPVLLRKDATVEEMPHLQDSSEIEDILVDLWLRKVDAVRIGDWTGHMSEEELVVLNPKAVLKFQGEGYPVYNKKRFENPGIDVYKAIYDTIHTHKLADSKDEIAVEYPQQPLQQQALQQQDNTLNEVEQQLRELLGEDVLTEQVYKVYHGTNQEFDKFDLRHATQGIIWFTDDMDSIKNQEHGGQGSKIIMTRYITLNNPAGWDEYEKLGLGQMRDRGYDGVILPKGNDHNDYIVFSPKSIRKNP